MRRPLLLLLGILLLTKPLESQTAARGASGDSFDFSPGE
jgi:hypothetical protein